MKHKHETNSVFSHHAPCPACQANGGDLNGDNLAMYSDGHGFCHACGHYESADVEDTPQRRQRTKMASKLIDSGEVRALVKRKLTEETCQKFGYTVSKLRNTPVQIAPYRDHSNQLIAQHIRTPDKEFKWRGEAKELQLWGQHLWRDNGKMVVVCEGEIDCMTVSQLQGNRWPVVSVPNGAQSAAKYIRQNIEWLEGFDSVVFCFDMDDPGRAAAEECSMLLTPGKAKIATLPLKDPNDCLRAGRGKEVIDALWGAKVFRPDGIINGADLWEEFKKEPIPGFEVSYPEFNEKLFGVRKKELVLFTAGSGIGKSTFVNELAYELFERHNQTIGVLALEESAKRSAERYAGIYLNKPIHITREGISEEQLKEAFDATMGSGRFWIYNHFGSTDIDTLLGKIRYMIVGLGCDFIILDHISIVVSGLDEEEESERKVIDKFMTRLRSLVEATGVGVLAVVHLKRPSMGKSYNEGRKVALSDLRGSGSLEQLSDVVVALERNQQGEDPDVATIRVLKNRPIGKLGEAGHVKYNHDTGRLLHWNDCPFEPDNPSEEGGQAEF